MDNSLYANLMSLVESNEAFYFMDYDNYRVFNYRLASYTDFCLPDALEARGIMFYLKEGQEPKLVCRPFKKFFNRNENPFTMNIDYSKIKKSAIKEDGSIITSFIDQETGKLRVKSKQSLISDQAAMAQAVLEDPSNFMLYEEVEDLTREDLTVMFELVSPANRIVLEYPKTELRVIGIRCNKTGNLIERDTLSDGIFMAVRNRWVFEMHNFSKNPKGATEAMVESIAGQQGIEGYVFTLEDGTMFKEKTDWYKSLHHLKDSVSNERHLFEAIIDETIDDVKAMFATDTFTMERIRSMEDKVIPRFNHIVKTIEDFYVANVSLERKEYALLGQKELGNLFNLAMGRYLGKGPDYKAFAKKYRKEIFEIGDSAVAEE